MPKRKLSVAAALASVLLVQACAYFTPTGRYGSEATDSDIASAGYTDDGPVPNINFFVADPEKKAPKDPRTIADLPEKAVEAAIKALTADGKPAKASDIVGLLNSELGKTDDKPAQDYTTLSKRIVVTVDGLPILAGGAKPADRLDALKVEFDLLNRACPGAKFTAWERLTNQRRSVSISQIESESGASFGVSAGLDTLSPDLESLGPSAEITRRLKETIAVKQDQLSLYGGLTEHNLYYVERGAPLVDLGGTTFVDFKMKLPEIGPFYVADSATLKDGKFDISARTVTLADLAKCKQLEIQMGWSAHIRRVIDGANTFIEADDKVHIQKLDVFSASAPSYNLSSMVEQANPALWKIAPINQSCQLVLTSKAFGDPSRPLLLRSVKDARTLLAWLRTQTAKEPWPVPGSDYVLQTECMDGAQPDLTQFEEQVFKLTPR